MGATFMLGGAFVVLVEGDKAESEYAGWLISEADALGISVDVLFDVLHVILNLGIMMLIASFAIACVTVLAACSAAAAAAATPAHSPALPSSSRPRLLPQVHVVAPIRGVHDDLDRCRWIAHAWRRRDSAREAAAARG